MDAEVPYMPSVKNLHSLLDKIQKAGVPETFGIDFLKDLGFTSSNDRSAIKVLKYLGMLDGSGKPQTSYREFVDHTKAKAVLASRLRVAFDDLFLADKDAHTRTTAKLKGWFKTKTGSGDAVAEKMATTFKSLASYADFSAPSQPVEKTVEESPPPPPRDPPVDERRGALETPLGLTFRVEVHLPDTTNIDTFRAIFRALREELLP